MLLSLIQTMMLGQAKNISSISDYPFSYGKTQFEGTGSHALELAKIGSNIDKLRTLLTKN